MFLTSYCDLCLEVDLGWQREYLQDNLAVNFTPYNLTNIPTTSYTVGSGRNSLVAGLDLLITFDKGRQVEANANYLLNSLFYDVFFYLGVGREF